MSRVDVRERDVHVYTPVLFGRWTLDVPYAEIDEAVLRRYEAEPDWKLPRRA